MFMIRVGNQEDTDSESSASEVMELVFAMPLLSISGDQPPPLAICDYDPEDYDAEFCYPDTITIDGDDHWDPEEMAQPLHDGIATGKAQWKCSECNGWTVRPCCYYCGWVICWPCHLMGKCYRLS